MQQGSEKRSNQEAVQPQPGEMNEFNQRNRLRSTRVEDAEKTPPTDASPDADESGRSQQEEDER